MSAIEAYPLCWPEGFARTARPRKSGFGNVGRGLTLYGARAEIEDEIRRLRGHDIIISTNMRIRRDGGVYSNEKEPTDSGVAVYFNRKGKQLVFACDRWATVKENCHAIVLSIEAMRGTERWGVSDMLERAFTGFAALPPPTSDWYRILGVTEDADFEDVRTAYRKAIAMNHPDRQGSHERAIELNGAWEAAQRHFGVKS